MSRVIVVGSGIVGLAVARKLTERGDEVIVLEKESDIALHQTGRNSGVIHSGLYYKPGSYKAKMCEAGARSMKEFAEANGVAHRITGKLVVATDESQLGQLSVLEERARANGVPARVVSIDEAREFEPNVRCVSALRVETTGIIDYVGVCRVLADQIRQAGGTLRFDEAFVSAKETAGRHRRHDREG